MGAAAAVDLHRVTLRTYNRFSKWQQTRSSRAATTLSTSVRDPSQDPVAAPSGGGASQNGAYAAHGPRPAADGHKLYIPKPGLRRSKNNKNEIKHGHLEHGRGAQA